MAETPLTPDELDAIRTRTEAAVNAWLWHEGTDDEVPGYGFHMSQVLYRLPRDSQTDDIKASIEGLVADVPVLLTQVDGLQYQLNRSNRIRHDQAAVKLGRPVAAIVCRDPEEHARSYNEGYEAAVVQGLADDPTLAGDWLDQHDAETIAAERERIRRAIKSAGDRHVAATREDHGRLVAVIVRSAFDAAAIVAMTPDESPDAMTEGKGA